jgi:uncharacterized iron-regulated protein
MVQPRTLQLWAFSLLLLLWCSPPALSEKMTRPAPQQCYSRSTILKALSQAQVIYLGETHDSAADHQAQLEILQALGARHSRLAIALEMFQRPFQSVLNRYLAGELTEVELQNQSQYIQRWGFPWSFYAPILRWAKERQIPLLAINTPTEVTRKVARQGLSSLTAADQQFIPPLTEIDTSNLAYRAQLQQLFTQSHQGKTTSLNFENFWAAQVLWDETMAAAIAEYLQAHPDAQVVVLAGKGHIAYGYGIPSRVARRMAAIGLPFRQVSVLLNPEADWLTPSAVPVADFLWRHQPD